MIIICLWFLKPESIMNKKQKGLEEPQSRSGHQKKLSNCQTKVFVSTQAA